ncbi:hypothetical protein FACS1894158_02240 [Betaproteobacteria bacterium]|nr:hypothetical protein FACS1894158_02240 [Betaproteobacteria bacterium]GHU18707.1 hypothetical protein FACS189475_04630 [Betaproteobacteria bacterium]
MKTSYPLPLPGYAVDLLLAAKLVCGSHEDIYRDKAHKRLSDAIGRFEEQMPLDPETSEILTFGPVPESKWDKP